MIPDRVVIVGAGPVGLVTAIRLADAGVPSVVLEASDTLPRDLRASTFHPPTIDMLDDLGVAKPLIAQGVVAPVWHVRMHETGEFVEFDLSCLAGHTRHPHRLQCEQYKLTPLLLERARATGKVDIRFGAAVLRVRQDDDSATAETETEKFTGRYLVGADGAHSVVRECIGVPLEGSTYPSETVLTTTQFPFEDHVPNLAVANYVWGRGECYSMFRLKDEWRCTFYPKPGETVDELLADEVLEKRLQGIVPRPERYTVREKRTYRIHQRIVPEYRKGRIVLAGDAAHLNAPTGGLGMNGGIHDAVNLSEKLTRIWRGESDALLDLYTRQRRPVAAQEMLGQSHQNRARMHEIDPVKRRESMAFMRDIAGDGAKMTAFLLRSSMIAGLRQAATVT